MRINVWGINYSPEVTGISPYNVALCEHLAQAGHEVRMITTFSYYPAWRKLAGDSGVFYRTDQMEGVRVYRCWHYVPRNVTPLRRMAHEGSFVLFSFLRQLFLPRADVLVVISPPLLLGAAAWVLNLVKRQPFVFHVQDLQPDAAAGLGMLQPGLLLRCLFLLEKLAYARAVRVSGITPGMVEAFRQKGVPAEKVFTFPNGVDLPREDQSPPRGLFRKRQGLPAGDFIVLYSGNLGVKQGLEVLIDAAGFLRDERIQIILCGEGSQREAFERELNARKLRNLRMLPLQSELHYHEMLVDADICVIPQQRGSGRYFFPSKLLRTLAFAKPVLTVADKQSELVQAVRAGCFGVNVEPGSAEELARSIENLAAQPAQLAAFSQAGREFVKQFQFETVLGQFEKVLLDLKRNSKAANRSRGG